MNPVAIQFQYQLGEGRPHARAVGAWWPDRPQKGPGCDSWDGAKEGASRIAMLPYTYIYIHMYVYV